MMENGNGTSACARSSQIPEYIYQELTENGRIELERHFADCDGCSAELTGMANAHLAVMRWRDEAFADLPTPNFVFPRDESSSVSTQAAKIGWLDSIRELFGRSVAIQWGGGLAAIAAVLLVVFLGISMFRLGNQPNGPVNAGSPGVDLASVNKQENPEKGVETPSKSPDATVVKVDPRSPENVPAMPRSSGGTGLNRKGPAQAAHVASAVKRVSRPLRKLPSLDDVADDDDKSLRLSELFEQIGS